jgi:hypothetical protein
LGTVILIEKGSEKESIKYRKSKLPNDSKYPIDTKQKIPEKRIKFEWREEMKNNARSKKSELPKASVTEILGRLVFQFIF